MGIKSPDGRLTHIFKHFDRGSWGNRLLFDYDTSQDAEIYEAYREIRDKGVTIFDTADSYGTLDLNGRAEFLLGEFERRYQKEMAEGAR